MSDDIPRCPECDGEGKGDCPCCGQTSECEHCDGTGLDPASIDTARWSHDCHEFTKAHGCSGGNKDGRKAFDGSGAVLKIHDYILDDAP